MIKETKSLFKKTKNGIDFFCEAQYDRHIEFLTTLQKGRISAMMNMIILLVLVIIIKSKQFETDILPETE